MKKVLVLCAFIALITLSCDNKKVKVEESTKVEDTTQTAEDSLREVGVVIDSKDSVK